MPKKRETTGTRLSYDVRRDTQNPHLNIGRPAALLRMSAFLRARHRKSLALLVCQLLRTLSIDLELDSVCSDSSFCRGVEKCSEGF